MSVLQLARTASTRFWLRLGLWTLGAAFAIGIPTVLIPNDFFRRMTPTRWWDFVLWAAAAPLIGLTMALRSLPAARACRVDGKAVAGGGLTYLAVACPICNKIIVALIGASGALSYFAPIQPILGVGAIALLLFALSRLLRTITAATANEDEAQIVEEAISQ